MTSNRIYVNANVWSVFYCYHFYVYIHLTLHELLVEILLPAVSVFSRSTATTVRPSLLALWEWAW